MRLKLALLIASLVLLVGCDHATKLWAHTELRRAPAIELVEGVVDLRYTSNENIAFSMLRELPSSVKSPLLIGFGTIAVAALVSYWYRRRHAPVLEQAAYVLCLGGAVGNLLDRIVRGYVVDFIHVHHWPIFNVADALLVAGVILLFLSHRRAAAPPGEAPPGVTA
jgi:signal peptidase II